MASNPFSSLMDPAQVGATLTNAFEMGMQRAQQAKTQQAFHNYLRDPNDQNAAEIARHDPQLGYRVMQDQQQRAEAARKQQMEAQQVDLQRRAAAGDKGALAQLAGIDLNAWDKLNDNDKQTAKEQAEYVGQAALAVSQLPEEQQPAAWDQYASYGAQRFPDLAQQVGKYSPQALQGAIAASNGVKTFLDLEKPDYMAIPEGGTLVNTRDPAAIAQFGGQPEAAAPQSSPQVTGILRKATAEQFITPEEAQVVQSSLGPNGSAAFQGWLQQNGVRVGKQVGGQTYYQVNGKWYDNPEGR